ncbi:MAG: PilZ domain-containing protein [Myxococcota bacterium]
MVDPDRFPLLTTLLAKDSNGAFRDELERFRDERVPRHPRREVRAVARLQAGAYQRSVVLWDVSRSGVSLVLPESAAPLRLEDLVDLRLVLRTELGVIEVKIVLVRMVSIRQAALQVAFRFEDLSDDDALALDQLGSLLVSDLLRASEDLLVDDPV